MKGWPCASGEILEAAREVERDGAEVGLGLHGTGERGEGVLAGVTEAENEADGPHVRVRRLAERDRRPSMRML